MHLYFYLYTLQKNSSVVTDEPTNAKNMAIHDLLDGGKMCHGQNKLNSELYTYWYKHMQMQMHLQDKTH